MRLFAVFTVFFILFQNTASLGVGRNYRFKMPMTLRELLPNISSIDNLHTSFLNRSFTTANIVPTYSTNITKKKIKRSTVLKEDYH